MGRVPATAVLGYHRPMSSSTVEEKPYREMVAAQGDDQIDHWAADLIVDFAKRRGVGTAIAAFCQVAGLDERGFQRVFLVGGGADHVIGIDTAGSSPRPSSSFPR